MPSPTFAKHPTFAAGPQGSPQGSTGPQGSLGNPRKPLMLRYFSGFVRYVLDFLSNITVFGQNSVSF